MLQNNVNVQRFHDIAPALLTESRGDIQFTSPSKYCAQFMLGPFFMQERCGWHQLPLSHSLKLTLSPELSSSSVKEGSRSLTVIGSILDPHHPAASDAEILKDLMCRFSSIETLTESTAKFGGRWVMIAIFNEHAWLFHDALGLRQVFYTDKGSTGAVWSMSQPSIAGELLRFDCDPAALGFMDSYEVRSNKEYRWPAQATIYREVKHLLPNHYLDLVSGETRRYWPTQKVQALGLDEAVDTLATLLSGLVEAASRRFDLALGLTAGLDSRMVLAACRPIKEKISCITVRQASMSEDHHDLVVPPKLLASLGLSHQIIPAPASMSANFSRRFKHNTGFAHDHYGPDVEAILNYFRRTKVALTGSGAEVGRCSFRAQLPGVKEKDIGPAELAMLQKMGGSSFALEHFAAWQMGVVERNGVHLLDLFEWEQGHGNWLAMTLLEFDLAWRDIFTPFNCRSVLSTMLGVKETYRSEPNHILFKKLIKKLWPETLLEPINPGHDRSTAKLLRRKLKFWMNYGSREPFLAS